LKPENILLDATHRHLKITDFGVSTVFKMQWEQSERKLSGKAGTSSFIAPEEWNDKTEYLPTKIDIWAVGLHCINSGIIFYLMLEKKFLWQISQEENAQFATYMRKIQSKSSFPPFEVLDYNHKELMYQILSLEPTKRPEISEILNMPWVEAIIVCNIENVNGIFAHPHNC
jgi:protein-serine/threonine kinase